MTTKKEILDYVSHTVENTNINVLNTMLDDILEGRIIPSGTTTITENGTHDVAEFAEAQVNVDTSIPTNLKSITIINNTDQDLPIYYMDYKGIMKDQQISRNGGEKEVYIPQNSTSDPSRAYWVVAWFNPSPASINFDGLVLTTNVSNNNCGFAKSGQSAFLYSFGPIPTTITITTSDI